jgi:hypothetical protein
MPGGLGGKSGEATGKPKKESPQGAANHGHEDGLSRPDQPNIEHEARDRPGRGSARGQCRNA